MDEQSSKGPLSPREPSPGMAEVERSRKPEPRDRVRGYKSLTGTARKLRRCSTDAERRLWHYLRNRQLAGFKFRRQVVIGNHVVDFACLEAKLIIEADGGQHAEQQAADAARTAELERKGFRVLRFWNHEILGETESVLERILAELNDTPSPRPSPGGRGRP